MNIDLRACLGAEFAKEQIVRKSVDEAVDSNQSTERENGNESNLRSIRSKLQSLISRLLN